ncbi:hypothetical protein AAHC03_013426 [Spirometra sp. Aus1]
MAPASLFVGLAETNSKAAEEARGVDAAATLSEAVTVSEVMGAVALKGNPTEVAGAASSPTGEARLLCEPPNSGLYGAGSTCLDVFNVPVDLTEVDLRPYFPSARSIKCQPYGACVLQFRSERDCQAVYDECQTGKNVGGQTVQAQFSEGHTSLASHGQQRSEMPHSHQGQKGRYGADNYGSNDGCVLKIHNLSWSVTDEELLQEYPRAVSASVMLTDQGRSRGWGTVTFSSPEDCQAAESSSSGRVINGRPIRVEIQDCYREASDEYRNRGRQYNDRQNEGKATTTTAADFVAVGVVAALVVSAKFAVLMTVEEICGETAVQVPTGDRGVEAVAAALLVEAPEDPE